MESPDDKYSEFRRWDRVVESRRDISAVNDTARGPRTGGLVGEGEYNYLLTERTLGLR